MAMRIASSALLAYLGAATATDSDASAHSHMQASSKSFRREVRRMEAEEKVNVKHFEETMTFKDAMHLWANKSQGQALIKTVDQVIDSSQHKVGKVQEHNNLRAQKKTDPAATGYSAVDSAVNMINEMITDVNQNHDKLSEECKNDFNQYCGDMEVCREEIAVANEESADARACILRNQKVINTEEVNLPRFRDELRKTEETCARRIADMEEALRIVLADIDVMKQVLEMVACDDTASSLVQMHGLQKHMANVSSKVKQQVVTALTAFTRGEPMMGPKVTKFENPPLHQEPIPGDPCDGISFDDAAVESRGCKIDRGGKNCWKLQDKFLLIQGGIVDEKDKLVLQLAQTRKECHETIELLKGMILASENALDGAQTKLAECTGSENSAVQTSRNEAKKHGDLAELMLATRSNCSQQLTDMESERCGLGKIRGKIGELQGTDASYFFKDCEQADWEAEDCSVSCGGGTEKLTRVVIQQPFKGAPCGPSEMLQNCNMDPCPVDCEMLDWSGWSSCSAECGGGVMQRTREVETQPMYDGEPCPEKSMTEACNVAACDKDCVLADWSEWSTCSKNCEGGTSFRTRSIAEAVVGQGNCAAEHDEARMNMLPCNTNGCLKEFLEEPIPCHATVDVILILDGSTSLEEDGWEATKKFAKTFVKAFTEEGSNAEMSVILFSGPTTWDDYYTCTGETQQTQEFMETTCGVKTVQHFSADLTATGAAIEALTWPKGSTLTQGALGTAAAELTLGRPDAPSVVVLVTDGQPISKYRTSLAADQVKATGARLLCVPVGGKGLSDDGMATLQGLVSFPPQDNLVELRTLRRLPTSAPLTRSSRTCAQKTLAESGAASQTSRQVMTQKSRLVIATSWSPRTRATRPTCG